VDLEIVSRLADKAVDSTGLAPNLWFELVKALSDYRQGSFQSASDWAQKVSAASERTVQRDIEGYAVVQAYAVLAMARHGMNQFGQARAALEKGTLFS
jgi:hypothetical protein